MKFAGNLVATKKEVATKDFEIGFANKLDRKHSLVARSYLVAR